jgi:hypothetical protein
LSIYANYTAGGPTPITFSGTDAMGNLADSIAGLRALNASLTDDLNA